METKQTADDIRAKLNGARNKLRKTRVAISGHEADINMLAHDEKKLMDEIETLEVDLIKAEDRATK
jgi:hypothetical protein